MISRRHRDKFVNLATADHVILSATIESFRRLFAQQYQTNAEAEFEVLRRLLSQKVPEHFAYEDEHVFPSLLNDRPPAYEVRLINELQLEHVTLLQMMRALNTKLASRTATNISGDLWVAMLDFIDALARHTAKEDVLFNPPPPTV